jgi:hypothetical protein
MSTGGEWRRDPTGRYEYRWWDGERYTEWVSRFGEQLVDHLPVPDGDPTIEVGFGTADRQNRWTVGFRLILAIPHLLWLTVVTFAAFFVLVVGWFAALFTAQLPAGIARFLYLVLRYHVRLLAYVYLLRDDYPPFRLGDERYPVVVETSPGRLNRVAVLFRLVLALPVLVLANWLSAGLTLVLIVLWVVVLANGRMPGLPAQAIAAVLRYEARTYGYVMMLSSEYPKELYGDRDPWASAREAGMVVPGDGDPGAPPRTARLYLGTGAKRLVTLFLVLGILQSVANNVLNYRVEERQGAAGTTAVERAVPSGK